MPLPDFTNEGDLPPGVHQTSMEEILARFGNGTSQRQNVTTRLLRIYHMAKTTGYLKRFIIFGSYITTKPAPNDVDIILVLDNEFQLTACDKEIQKLFDHMEATEEFGASVFWIRPAMLILETLEDFITHWQARRDGSRRGIVEVTI